MIRTFPARALRPLLSAAVVTVFAVSSLTACGDDSAESSSSPDSRDVPLPDGVTPATLIIEAAASPEGFTHTPPDYEGQADLAALLNNPEEPVQLPAVDPLQCTGLALDGATFLTWMSEPADSTAVASYTRVDNDAQGVFVMLTTTPSDPATLPTDLAECASFTKTLSTSVGTNVTTFQATGESMDAEGATVLAAAKVTVTGSTFEGEDVPAENAQGTIRILTATVRGATFTILADESTSPEQVSALATAQAKRILDA